MDEQMEEKNKENPDQKHIIVIIHALAIQRHTNFHTNFWLWAYGMSAKQVKPISPAHQTKVSTQSTPPPIGIQYYAPV